MMVIRTGAPFRSWASFRPAKSGADDDDVMIGHAGASP